MTDADSSRLANEVWEQLSARMARTVDGVDFGRMMSSPGLVWKDDKGRSRVFCFHNPSGKFAGMGFRLGRQFDAAKAGLENCAVLSPFQSKPPLYDWFVVPASECNHWPDLAQRALRFMQGSK
ncbi:MAG: hypothetical protein WBO55_02900 [Rhizobiaceae bacterium]